MGPHFTDGTISCIDALLHPSALNEPLALNIADSISDAFPNVLEVSFQGQLIALAFTPDHVRILDVPVQSLFLLVRADMLPLYVGQDVNNYQLMLGFEGIRELIVHESEEAATDLSIGEYQELATLVNQTIDPPRFELLLRENLTQHLERLRVEAMATPTDSDTYDSPYSSGEERSLSSTPRELSPELLELEYQPADLGLPAVMCAPERRITRSMTRAAEDPQPDPAAIADPPRPKRIIRRVVLDYEDIIHNAPVFARTSRL
ncbi:hypothetical protein BG003_005422 [Podila horticola]|nr:hypothetical protein BG003_005422 [Podila horticola]